MNREKKHPSERIEGLIGWIQECRRDYKAAEEAVKEEDKKVQDFLHAMEFAPDGRERNRIATRLHESRKERRRNKDRMQELEYIVNFCSGTEARKVIGNLSQLLGNQRKREEYLYGERHYNQRSGSTVQGTGKEEEKDERKRGNGNGV